MDKINRSRRIHFLLQYIPASLGPEIGVFFGEHVIRVGGQLCLVVTLDGDVGVRATDPELEAQLLARCGRRHWIAHGRVYEQWYLLPGDCTLNRAPVPQWLKTSAEGAYRLVEQERHRLNA